MKSSKWLIVALIVSAGVNLALIGFIAGKAAQPPKGPIGDPMRALPHFAKHLPSKRHKEVRPLVREHLLTVRPNLREMRRLQRQINRLITSQSIDKNALTEKLTQLYQIQNQMQNEGITTFVNFVSQLSLTERQTLVSSQQQIRRPRLNNTPNKTLEKE